MNGLKRIIWHEVIVQLGKETETISESTKTKDIFKSNEELFQYIQKMSAHFEEMFGKTIEKEFDESVVYYIFPTMKQIFSYYNLRMDA